MSYFARLLRSGDIKKDEEKCGTYSQLMEVDMPTATRKTNVASRCLRYLCWGLGGITLLFILLCAVGYHYSDLEDSVDGDGNQNGVIKQGASGAFVRIARAIWKCVKGLEVFAFVGTIITGFLGWFPNLFSRND